MTGLQLPPMTIIDLACGVAEVISILHSKNIAHRDIKSANVMVLL